MVIVAFRSVSEAPGAPAVKFLMTPYVPAAGGLSLNAADVFSCVKAALFKFNIAVRQRRCKPVVWTIAWVRKLGFPLRSKLVSYSI